MSKHAIQLTMNNIGDSQVLSDLVDKVSLEEQIDSVYTDGSYNTQECRQVISN